MKGEQIKLQLELQELLKLHLKVLQALESLEESQLQSQPDGGKWSALECLEHLCRYSDFYLPEVRKSIEGKNPQPFGTFRSSRLGEYFAQSMWPKPGYKTMNTFKSMNPHYSGLRKSVLIEFRSQLIEWESVIEEASKYSWQKVKTGISISKYIKLRLGDTLRVVFYHNHRHLQQALAATNLSIPEFSNYTKSE